MVLLIAPRGDQNLQAQKQQRRCSKPLIPWNPCVDGGSFKFGLLNISDIIVVDIRHIDSLRTGRDVSPFALRCNGIQHLTVHFGPNLLTFVLQKSVSIHLAIRNSCALIHITETDSKDSDALFFVKFFSNGSRITFMVLAISKQHDRFMFIRFIHESCSRRFDGISQSGPTQSQRMRTHAFKNLFEVVVMTG